MWLLQDRKDYFPHIEMQESFYDMDNALFKTYSSGVDCVEIIELIGELSGYRAIQTRRCLLQRIVQRKPKDYAIIDLKYVSKIDGLGIDIIEQLMIHFTDICLANVSMEIKCMLNIANKRNLLDRIHDEKSRVNTICRFEKESLQKNETMLVHAPTLNNHATNSTLL